MEAAIERQILSLEELSNDLFAIDRDNGKTKDEDLIKDRFDGLILAKLDNIRRMLESDDKSLGILLEDDDIKDNEVSSVDILQLLQNIKSDILALDDDEIFKDEAAAKEETPKVAEVKDQNPPVNCIKKEKIVIKKEPDTNTNKTTTLFLCPMDGCDFSTNKEGMLATAQRAGKAAQHLKMEHKIRAVDMKPGMYKFNKVKYEI